MKIEQMTSPEIEEKLKKTQTVIVPISPIEQHGAHCPISADYLLGYEISRRAAEKANVFSLPPIILGYNNKGSSFPGTVSVSINTLKSVVVDICKSLKHTGFKKIIIVSGHGGKGHVKAIESALNELNDKQIILLRVTELVGREAMQEIVETKNDRHAGEFETSIMLYLDPKEVKMDKAVSFFPEYPDDITPEEYKKLNPSGVHGDPTKATEEKGEKLVKAAVENLLKIIKQ